MGGSSLNSRPVSSVAIEPTAFSATRSVNMPKPIGNAMLIVHDGTGRPVVDSAAVWNSRIVFPAATHVHSAKAGAASVIEIASNAWRTRGPT